MCTLETGEQQGAPRALAKGHQALESFLAAGAIEAFVDVNGWRGSRRAVAEADAGDAYVAHEEVVAWL